MLNKNQLDEIKTLESLDQLIGFQKGSVFPVKIDKDMIGGESSSSGRNTPTYVFVDNVNGDDTTGAAYNSGTPFETIAAAQAVAVAPTDTIYVRYTGTEYTDDINLIWSDSNCKYFFERGTVYRTTTSSAFETFTTSIDVLVSGYCQFKHDGGDAVPFVNGTGNGVVGLELECESIIQNNGTFPMFNLASGLGLHFILLRTTDGCVLGSADTTSPLFDDKVATLFESSASYIFCSTTSRTNQTNDLARSGSNSGAVVYQNETGRANPKLQIEMPLTGDILFNNTATYPGSYLDLDTTKITGHLLFRGQTSLNIKANIWVENSLSNLTYRLTCLGTSETSVINTTMNYDTTNSDIYVGTSGGLSIQNCRMTPSIVLSDLSQGSGDVNTGLTFELDTTSIESDNTAIVDMNGSSGDIYIRDCNLYGTGTNAVDGDAGRTIYIKSTDSNLPLSANVTDSRGGFTQDANLKVKVNSNNL